MFSVEQKGDYAEMWSGAFAMTTTPWRYARVCINVGEKKKYLRFKNGRGVAVIPLRFDTGTQKDGIVCVEGNVDIEEKLGSGTRPRINYRLWFKRKGIDLFALVPEIKER